jgi:hypothetical protein
MLANPEPHRLLVLPNNSRRCLLRILPRVVCVAVIVLLFGLGTRALADQESEYYKIVYLLNAVGSSNLVFIRNGAEYNCKEAQAHLQEKLDSSGNLIRTADDFIAYIASKSLITGEPYQVRLADGTQVNAEIWLRDKLAEMK